MTREQETIEILKAYRNKLSDSVSNQLEGDIEAFETAIKALEQEPCDKYIKEIDHLRKYIYKLETQIVEQEPCEDAISRQAAIEAVRLGVLSTATLYGRTEEGETARKEIERILKASLPSVSTEKTGHWIFVDKAKEHAHCSECDYGDVDLFDGRPHNYCPNCGARMVEPQESEDKE